MGSGSYSQKARRGGTTVIGLAQGDAVRYSVEIQRGEIVQFEGKGRAKPAPELRGALEELLGKSGLGKG